LEKIVCHIFAVFRFNLIFCNLLNEFVKIRKNKTTSIIVAVGMLAKVAKAKSPKTSIVDRLSEKMTEMYEKKPDDWRFAMRILIDGIRATREAMLTKPCP